MNFGDDDSGCHASRYTVIMYMYIHIFSLECIGLKDNCVTDNGILAWTLPHRMFRSGPELLRMLDLSCNPGLTDSCVKCVVKYPHLESLNLSGTEVTITTGVKQIMKLTQLKMVSYVSQCSYSTIYMLDLFSFKLRNIER